MGNCFKRQRKSDIPASSNSQTENLQDKSNLKLKAPKSWETRPKLKKEDFEFKNRENETLIKKPGQINGQQFIIENCKECTIFLLDYNATVFVDDCTKCKIFIGPCSSSVFVRNCSDLSVIVACQQYRISESQRINSLLFCTTQPTLEKSSQLKFGCFNFGYFNLREQFEKANLNIWNNSWFEVFDFSKAESANYGFFAKNTDPNSLIDQLDNEQLEDVGLFRNQEELSKNSIIPMTIGNMKKTEGEEILFLIMPEQISKIEMIIPMINSLEDVELARSKALILDKSQINELFPTKTQINLEELLSIKKETLFLLFTGKNTMKIKEIIGQECDTKMFYLWEKKETIKKVSGLVFDSWKSENAILK